MEKDLRPGEFDGRLVQITDVRGDVFEGFCSFDCEEYCEHEFGRSEEALEIMNCLFFRSDIASVKNIEEFSEPFGLIEELIVDEGAKDVEDALDDGEKEEILRILLCLKERIKKAPPNEPSPFASLAVTLKEIESDDKRINDAAGEIINLLG